MRGDGRVYTRPGSPFLWMSYYFGGKEQRESTGIRVAEKNAENKANKLLQKRLGQIHRGKFFGLESERLRVDDLLDSYIDSLTLRGAKSLRSVKGHVVPVRAFFAGMLAVRVTAAEVQQFTQERVAGCEAPATTNRRLQALRAAYRLAVKQERITRAPWIGLLREDNARKVFYEPDEAERLFAALPATVADVARFSFLVGWRRAEVLNLPWSSVDLKRGEIRLATSKNGQGRVLPLAIPELAAIFERAKERRVFEREEGGEEISEIVFHNGLGKPIASFQRSWRTAHKTAGIPYRHFHDLRHSAARHLRRAGVDKSTIKEIGGWKTDAMFYRYDIVDTQDQREAQRKLALHLNEAPAEKSNVTPIKSDGAQR